MVRRHKIFLVGMGIALAVLGLSAATVLQTRAEVAQLQSELTGFIVPAVDSKAGLSLRASAIVPIFAERDKLRLKRFVVETRLNPLFGLSGVNLNAFETSIEDLQNSLDNFVELYSEEDKALLESHFYPIAFLEALHDTETLRRAFLSSPSKERAREYHTKLLEVQSSHEEALQSLIAVLREKGAEKDHLTTRIGFVGGETSIEYMLGVLDTEYERTRAPRKDINNRWRCFEGYTSKCIPLAEQLALLQPEENHTAATISARTSSNAHLLRTFREFDSTALRSEALPFVALSDSSCFESPALFVPWEKHVGRGTSLEAELANDLIFIDTEAADSTYFKKLREGGQRYFYQPMTNLYLCPDLALDLSRMSTVLDIQSVLKEQPLFVGSKFDELGTLETRIVSADTLADTDVQNYVHAVAELLMREGEQKLADVVGETQTLRAESLLTHFYQGTSQFDRLIQNAIHQNEVIRPIAALGDDMNTTFLFTVRGYQSLMLGFFNRSVTAHTPKLLELQFLQPYTYHVPYEVLGRQFDTLEILTRMIEGTRIERRVGSEV